MTRTCPQCGFQKPPPQLAASLVCERFGVLLFT